MNQVVTFDGSASTGQVPIVAYKWNFGDGGTGTGAVVQHVYTNPGTYNVALVVVDERGNDDTETRSITIIVPLHRPTPPSDTGTSTNCQPTAAPTQAPQPTATAAPTQAPAATATAVPTQPPAAYCHR